MTTALRNNALEETYLDVELLIKHVVHKFLKTNGTQYGDFEELFSIVNVEFMKMFPRYTPEKGKFSTWCHWCASKALLEHQRNHIRRDRRCRITPTDMTETEPTARTSQFSLFEFVDGLSQDAKVMVELALDTPADLAAIMREEGASHYKTREVIRQFLTGYGWTGKRIRDAFREIQAALETC